MNTVAAIAFITVMLTGIGGLTGLVWRDRRRTAQPAPAGYLYTDQIVGIHYSGGDIYQETVAALGDPNDIDTTADCPPWPADAEPTA